MKKNKEKIQKNVGKMKGKGLSAIRRKRKFNF